MDPTFQLASISLPQLALISAVTVAASILGGLAGYGVGLILPIFLAPVIGIVNVVPVMAIVATVTNASRIAAFYRDINRKQVRDVLAGGLPASMVGAYAFTRLDTPSIALLLGLFLVLSVPLRRMLARSRYQLEQRGVMVAGAGYGLLAGGTTGTGLFLLSILMAAGVQGAALIGTDAVVALIINAAKVAVFSGSLRIDAQIALAGLLIGLCTVPGAFVARWLIRKFSVQAHTAIMDVVVIVGGMGFLWRALQ